MEFKEGAMYISQEYKLSIAEANSFLKGILEDIEYYKEKRLNNLEDLKNYLKELENKGK